MIGQKSLCRFAHSLLFKIKASTEKRLIDSAWWLKRGQASNKYILRDQSWNTNDLWKILVDGNIPRADWNGADMTQHYIRYWIQLFRTIKKKKSWGSRARPYSWACFNQRESVVTPTLLCKLPIYLWSLFEIVHIFCEGSAGRGIINKDKPNTDLLANCFQGNLILCWSTPGLLPLHQSSATLARSSLVLGN